jgi:predicted amidohydrolase YtcJ
VKNFDKAMKELREVVRMPDQKHWNYVEMRERALNEWIDRWFTTVKREQLVLNHKDMPSEYQDYLKEQLFTQILDVLMEENAIISTEKNKMVGELVCLRRNPRE